MSTSAISEPKVVLDYSARLKMIDEINNLSDSEHDQIYQILKRNDCRVSENLNGVFVNLAHIPEEVLANILSVITFWSDQKHHIQNSELHRSALCRVASETDHPDNGGNDNTPDTFNNGNDNDPGNGNGADTCDGTDDCTTTRTDNGTACLMVTHRAIASAPNVHPKRSAFKETTVSNKQLTQKELSVVRGESEKRKKITLNKRGRTILKNGGSALRVAKKCLAAEDT
jgi:hypothetical protein